MPITKTYQCPDCDGYFDYLHHPEKSPPPDECPLCGSDVSGKKTNKNKAKKAKNVSRVLSPRKPIILSGERSTRARKVVKSGDEVYRAMERSSEVRQEMAADNLGVDKSSTKALRMTDMKDNLKTGDLSFKTDGASQAVQNMGAVTHMSGTNISGQSFQVDGSSFASTVGQGPYPYAGNKTREMLTSGHAARAAAVVASGRKG